MSQQSPTDVFISYKRRKRPEVEHIAAALRALKLTVWFDARLEPGVSFSDEIATEVRRAGAVLVCWTNDCFPHGGDENGWVRAEASIARGRGVYVPCFLETADLDPPFNNDHAESLIGWAGHDGLGPQDYEGWLDLLAAIGKKVGRPGLAAYSKAQARGDIEGLRRFAQDYPADPLADGVWGEIAEADAAAARARTEAQRKAALEAANRPTAPPPPEAPKFRPAKPPQTEAPPKAPPEKRSSRASMILGVVGGLVVLGAAAFGVWFLMGPAQRLRVSEGAVSVDRDAAPIPVSPPALAGTSGPASEASPEETAWTEMGARTRAKLEAFLSAYPQSRRADEARESLGEMALSELSRARAVGTSHALREWIVAWPNRPEVVEVRSELNAATTRERQKALDEAREQAKAAQSKTNTAPANPNACPTERFVIYFDWDRSNLNGQAIETIDAALARVRTCTFRAVEVVGHTDTERSAQYALSLSQRRAEAVRDALIARRVPASVVTSEARGETQLAKQTADGVREPLNRRAEVTMTFR